MPKRKNSKTIRNDFAPEEEDIYSFTDEPIAGNCISSFSFEEASTDKTNGSSTKAHENIEANKNNTISATSETNTKNSLEFNTPTNNIPNNSNTSSTKEKTISNTNILKDNRYTPISNGSAPPIDGENLDVKRTYILRASTVRKINELKSINSELNTYVSTIVDIAIAYYYDHIINEDDKQ